MPNISSRSIPRLTVNQDWPKASCSPREQSASRLRRISLRL
jgi:hypothetical protein